LAKKHREYKPTIDRFSGYADTYDAFRPRAPEVVMDILCQLAQTESPELVVDMGCGTGHSTRLWAARAARVVGADISEDMLAQARLSTHAKNVIYQQTLSAETGLCEGTADIVTCSQSLHWMDPATTFPEAVRVLRPGGVFAAYDNAWPPAIGVWDVEQAWQQVTKRVNLALKERSLAQNVKRWSKAEHLARMRECRLFRYVNEVAFHNVEQGGAKRLVGLLLSQGSVQTLLKSGVAEAEFGLNEFRELVSTRLGSNQSRWYFSYRMRVGVV
jgi:SAM-dependent methyltransferase